MSNNEGNKNFSVEEWAALIKASVSSSTVNGIRFPQFPAASIQEQFVGSSYEDAINEATAFYIFVSNHAKDNNFVFDKQKAALDFGTGWGRFTRFLWKDFDPKKIWAVDIDKEMIELCAKNGLPGNLQHIEPRGKLPIEDNGLDLIIAYSVFTHLPLNIHIHWAEEFKRKVRPGGLVFLTVEPRRFLNFIKKLAWKKQHSGWHSALAKHGRKARTYTREFDRKGFVYIPTGGGSIRTADIYGEAVCSQKFLEELWGPEFEVIEYVDDPTRFWQAAVALRRKNEISSS